MNNLFAVFFSALLKDRNITQTQMAKALQVKQNTVSQWKDGKREPDFDILLKICLLLDVAPSEMLGFKSFEDNFGKEFIRSIIGNDSEFQKEQAALTDVLMRNNLSGEEMQKEYDILFDKYYKKFQAIFGFKDL